MRIILIAMDYVSEINATEARLKAAGKHVKTLLEEADVSASQWQRWKNTGQIPHRTTWSRIVSATEKVLSEREEAAA